MVVILLHCIYYCALNFHEVCSFVGRALNLAIIRIMLTLWVMFNTMNHYF